MPRLGFTGYFLGLLPGILAIVGNLKGGPWTLATTAMIGSLCVADWFVRDDQAPPPEAPRWTPDLVLRCTSSSTRWPSPRCSTGSPAGSSARIAPSTRRSRPG